MATYAFDFIGEDGAISSVDVSVHTTDADAVRHARFALRSRLTAAALDVWREGRRLIQLTRSDVDLDSDAKFSGEEAGRVTPLFTPRPGCTETKTV